MSQDLKLSTAQASYEAQVSGQSGPTKKSSSGCGCVFAGCFGLLLLILIPIISSVIFISTLDGSSVGEMIAGFASKPEYVKEFKDGINSSSMTSDEKKIMLDLYDKFLIEYTNLTPEQKTLIHKDIFNLIKTIFSDLGTLDGSSPPPEFLEILNLLKMDLNTLQSLPSSSLPSSTTPAATPPQTPSTTGDPYNFDDVPKTPPVPTPPVTLPPTQTHKTEYDF